MNRRQHIILIRIICAAVALTAGAILSAMPLTAFISLYFYLAAAIIVGFDVVISAFNGIIHGHVLDENFLMMIGSLCAFLLGEYAEGTFILLFYQVGELFQGIAVGKTRRSIASLMDIRPDYANLVHDGAIQQVDPYDVAVGDIIIVEPGEKIPLDGIVLQGSSAVDTSSLTGESVPREVGVGKAVISGSINLTSPLTIEVTKEFEQSTVMKILELAENASERKAKTENFVTTFAKYYTPAVVGAAVLVAVIPPLFTGEWSTWILRAVMFVVISCPCALVVSVPMAFFGALGGASKIGVLIKGSNFLEALVLTDTFIFDKTGTLTKGKFKVTGLYPAAGVTEKELLMTAAACESHSSHPIALSIKEAFGGETLFEGEFESIAGKGVKLTSADFTAVAGSSVLLSEMGFSVPEVYSPATAVHVAREKYLGYILISDEVKASSKMALDELRKLGAAKTVMLTGDGREVAEEVAAALELDEYRCELLPAQKVEAAEEIIARSRGKVAFAGDGVNDAPVLGRVDVGIAMGGLGSDAAIEAADVVIMNDDLSLLPKAVKIARKAMNISKQNIVMALGVKFSFLLLSFVGLSNIWMAVFADVGVLILAILNSMRCLCVKK